MQAFYCDEFVLPLPQGHRFPMSKYRLLRERVLAEGLVGRADLRVPAAASREALTLAHDPDYVDRVFDGRLTPREVRALGFPWSPELVERSRRSVGGTIGACRAALGGDGVGVNLAGGTHHAYRDHGEGYCVFNDAVVAVRVLQREGKVRDAVVIDCDVHQGQGTAAMTAGDDSVVTLSLHGERNYPLRKERSDLDVALPDGTGDDAYLAALDDALGRVLERSFDLAVYVSGADPLAGDRLGRLALSKEGLAARDERVLRRCRAVGAAVAVTMAGGYGERVEDTVDVHLGTVRAAAEAARAPIA